jgi:hypothetical protein
MAESDWLRPKLLRLAVEDGVEVIVVALTRDAHNNSQQSTMTLAFLPLRDHTVLRCNGALALVASILFALNAISSATSLNFLCSVRGVYGTSLCASLS